MIAVIAITVIVYLAFHLHGVSAAPRSVVTHVWPEILVAKRSRHGAYSSGGDDGQAPWMGGRLK
jgi:hypothetical protein